MYGIKKLRVGNVCASSGTHSLRYACSTYSSQLPILTSYTQEPIRSMHNLEERDKSTSFSCVQLFLQLNEQAFKLRSAYSSLEVHTLRQQCVLFVSSAYSSLVVRTLRQQCNVYYVVGSGLRIVASYHTFLPTYSARRVLIFLYIYT